MEKRINYCCILMLLLFAGCRQSLNQKEYVSYLTGAKSPLKQMESLGPVTYECRLLTPELIGLLQRGNAYNSKKELADDVQNTAEQLNFVLVIKDNTKVGSDAVKEAVFNKDKYSEFMAYGNSRLQDDFELELDGGEVVPCTMVHIEAANSINPVMRISGSFKINIKNENTFRLVFNDNFFNTGKIKFCYNKTMFEQLPQINI